MRGKTARQKTLQADGDYVMTSAGPMKWCQVLSTEGHKHCNLEFCRNLHVTLAAEERRTRVKRRPHSFPRPWWDSVRGRPVPKDERVPI